MLVNFLFELMFSWRSFLISHLSTYHLNIGVWINAMFGFKLDASTYSKQMGSKPLCLPMVHLFLCYYYNFTPKLPSFFFFLVSFFCLSVDWLKDWLFGFSVLKDISTFYRVVDDCIESHIHAVKISKYVQELHISSFIAIWLLKFIG